MKELTLIIWIGLYPLICTLGIYIYTKKELLLDSNYNVKDDKILGLSSFIELFLA